MKKKKKKKKTVEWWWWWGVEYYAYVRLDRDILYA